jgi:hypothetical protein
MTPKQFTRIMLRTLAVSCALIVPAAAQVSVLSDLENGSNENAYGQYWYIYADTADGGNSKCTNMTQKADGSYNFLPTKDQGNTLAGGTPGYGAKVDFKLGNVKPHNASASWGNMIGAGTMLAAEGQYFDLTGAQKIEFYAKVSGPATSVDMRVEVCTQELEADFGFYHIIIPITDQWAKYTIPLDTVDKGFGKLEQWDWSVTGNGAKPFNLQKVSKIQWCISEDGNSTKWADAVGTLWLDDISVSPFTPHFRDEIEAAKLGAPGGTGLDAKALLTDMEKNANATKFYSYCYTDVEANPTGASTITAGATMDSLTGKYLLVLTEGTGVAASKCAAITFELGTTFTSGANLVMPFAGIGTNLSNDLGTVSTDLTPATAIYFDYKLKSDKIPFLTFEVRTNQTFGNADAVYYVKLPSTNGEWKGATIDLKAATPELVLPLWTDVTPSPLSLAQTMKFQWKAQGPARATGDFAIDNVYVVGKDFTPVMFGKTVKTATPDFVVKQTASAANIAFTMPQQVNAARLELVTVQGKVIASQSVKNAGKALYQASFQTGNLASGSYLVRLNAENTIVKSAMVSIVK